MGDPGDLAFHPVLSALMPGFERRLPIQLSHPKGLSL
jgi:hypothetical protein